MIAIRHPFAQKQASLFKPSQDILTGAIVFKIICLLVAAHARVRTGGACPLLSLWCVAKQRSPAVPCETQQCPMVEINA